jgi:hypothetical protein
MIKITLPILNILLITFLIFVLHTKVENLIHMKQA